MPSHGTASQHAWLGARHYRKSLAQAQHYGRPYVRVRVCERHRNSMVRMGRGMCVSRAAAGMRVVRGMLGPVPAQCASTKHQHQHSPTPARTG